MRLDKWLWAARFFKTRSLAQQAIAAGRVKLNDARVKPAHDVKAGDALVDPHRRLRVAGRGESALGQARAGGGGAQALRGDARRAASERERRQDLRRWGAEPANALKGRPTKRDRRRIEDFTSPSDES